MQNTSKKTMDQPTRLKQWKFSDFYWHVYKIYEPSFHLFLPFCNFLLVTNELKLNLINL